MAVGSRSADPDPFYHLVGLIYRVLRPPKLRLRAVSVPLPSETTVLCGLLFSYFLVTSGVVYDVITEAQGIGGKQEENGKVRPMVFMEGRLNGQYIIEGISAGFMFMLGALGLIMLDLATDKAKSRNTRMIVGGLGLFMAYVAYSMAMVFLRIKVPGYMR